MECKICREHLNQDLNLPIVLSCGHTICKSCLKKITRTGNNTCPFDRTKFGAQEKFKINFFVLELLDHPYQTPAKLPPLPPSSNPSCGLSHPLTQISTFSELNLPESNSKCSYCKLPCLSNLLFCKECTLLLCEDCSKDELSCLHQESRKVFCKNNHELKYYSNSASFYSRKHKNTRKVSCNLCSSSHFGGSWACRLCHFDLCLNCIYRIQIGSSLICSCNHHMDPLILDSQKNFTCSLCEVLTQKFGFECFLCRIQLCEKCIDYSARASLDDKLTCTKGHRLRYSEDPYCYHSDLFKNPFFYCDCCGQETAQSKVFHCLACRTLICDLCIGKIRDGMEYVSILKPQVLSRPNHMKTCRICGMTKENEDFEFIICDLQCTICSCCKKNDTERCQVCLRYYSDYERQMFAYF